MSLLDIAKNYANGAETLKDWLGSGGEVVSHDEAEQRSQVCISGDTDKDGNPAPCRFNVAPGWLEKNLTHPAAKFIKSQLELKRGANLHLENDFKLGMCKQCGCDLELKPWVPIKHILAHPPLEPFPSWCWITKETP